MLRALLLSLILASASAFTVAPATRAVPTRLHAFSMEKEQKVDVMVAGADCVESECSTDDLSALVRELKATKRDLSNRLDKLDTMIDQLASINEQKKQERRKKREEGRPGFWRQLGLDAVRVFYIKKPDIPPMGIGYGKGPYYASDFYEWVPKSQRAKKPATGAN